MLELKKLNAGYGELKVLKDVDLSVKPGEIIALIGPNGAGKSTILKAIFNISDITKGSIKFNGKNVLGLPTHQLIKNGISYVSQGRIVFDTLTVKENLEMGGTLIKDKMLLQKNINEVFNTFPILQERQNELAFTLSGGQRQQLALGRALMHKPKLLLLDEPSLGLSPKLQKELFKTIQSLNKDEISILIVEQNAKKAIEIATRTYLLEDGKVVLTGGKKILENPKIKNVYLGGRY